MKNEGCEFPRAHYYECEVITLCRKSQCGWKNINNEVYEEVIMGQSWSSKRKKLEDELLCKALRGRVQ